MRTSIATVCLAGSLVEKLHACAAAGFDGVEIMDSDLISAEESPEEIRELCRRLGLRIDLFQPFRDFEGVDEATFESNMRRAEAKFAVMNRLGAKMMLLCSNVATATNPDPARAAEQLGALADAASRHGIRIAYEALAWGKYVSDYRDAWSIVERADRANLGLCLDSFHILSRGHDLRGIEEIDPYKLFFLQLADAPRKDMDLLSWSRHHRLFPGEGSFDLTRFLTHVVRAGYDGPVSLEVFNDTFRQVDVGGTAVHARRSLRWLEDAVARELGDDAPAGLAPLAGGGMPAGFDFVEIKADDTSGIEALLETVGFTPRGTHRTKPVTLWTAGEARIVLNEQHARDLDPHIAAVGFAVPDAAALSARAAALGTPAAYRRTHAGEELLDGAVAPDGTEIYWTAHHAAAEPAWTTEFEHGESPRESPVARVDHVSLAQPWQVVDEAILFFSSVLELPTASSTEVASPHGLVQSRVIQSPDGAIRIPLNVSPPILSGRRAAMAQHIAFACDDIVALARAARARGLRPLPIPRNYYEDLAARFALDDGFLATLRELDLVFDRDEQGEYLHFYTATVGDLFCEFVERRGRYDGYGAGNAPVRHSVQRAGGGRR